MISKHYLDSVRPTYRNGGGTDKDDKYTKSLNNALGVAKTLGLAKYTKDLDFTPHYRHNLYMLVDPTAAYPRDIARAYNYLNIAKTAKKSTKHFTEKIRETNDNTADAAWAKRLGLYYDKTYLPSNKDGSVRLPNSIESQIPVDTTFLKNRIAENEKLTNYYNTVYGEIPSNKRDAIELGLQIDKETLEALRKTFKTGKPVTINEHGYIDREWIKDGSTNFTPSPLNVLQNYTIQYDKTNNKMNYWDIYDFNKFEDFVPGEAFEIRGSVPVRKQVKKQLGGLIRRTLATGGSIHINSSRRSNINKVKTRNIRN